MTNAQVMIATLALVLAGWLAAAKMSGQTADRRLRIGGTIRAKYEYQTRESKGRFQVRTARLNVSGQVNPAVSYKAEIDLCDEGEIKMLDAYVAVAPFAYSRRPSSLGSLKFTVGQMRVPFTIDAHRSPDQQYFANRSFIAKQVGNVRDVGAKLGYTLQVGFPIVMEAGMYNGSGLTNQKDFWTNNVNFSAKAQICLPVGLNVVLSAQKVKPADVGIMMYDGGLTFHHRNLIVEAEYLYKHYAHGAFRPVHAFDSFMSYDIPLKGRLVEKVSPLVRYDFMTDHSDGKPDDTGRLIVNDYKRGRLTGGATLSLDRPFVSDVRINYEKYFYGHGATPKPSERDKIVVELMVHF